MPKELANDLLTRLRRAKSAEKVRKLLKELPDHNVLSDDGDTLLHSYVRRKDKHKHDCLLALLVYGNVDVDRGNKQGFTPLHLAAELNDFMSTQALLAFGCDVNSLNPDHCTPLDIALRSGTDVVDLLISVGGQTGAVTAKGLYALKRLRFEASHGPNWRPEGNIVQKHYHCNNHDDHTDHVKLDSDELKEMLQKASSNDTDSPDDGAHRKPLKVRFDTPDRYLTPDHSVTMGMTLESISLARSKVGIITSSLPPPVVTVTTEEELYHQRSHDMSHDEPDVAIENTHDPDERSHDQEATPPNNQLAVECEGGSEDEGNDSSSSDEGLSEGLVDDVVFSHTPLEQQSLHTLGQIENGSLTAEAYMDWQEHRSLRQRMDSLEPLGSIRNRLRVEDSLRRTCSEGEEGCVQGAGLVPDAFRVKPGDHVLCLDGGGIRGLVQLEILRHVEELTQRRIVDLFDWIVGTSTGGILALGLVYGKMTCIQLRQLYFELKDHVFKNPTLGLACNTHELERILKERFGEDMTMSHSHKPRVLVCAVNKATTALELTFFNNCFNDDFSDELVWKVARYTSAAPIYFTECDNYVDGGLLANNPCNDALTKIQTYQKANGGSLSLVVSIGSGIYPPEPIGNTDIFVGKTWYHTPSKLKNIRLLLTALMDCSERVSDDCRCRCEQQDPPIHYFRFNPQLPVAIESIETDGAKLCDLIIKAKQLLETNDLQLDLLIQHFYYMTVQRMNIR